jgi:Raf kinase inhibitor-like YbhB/YbcL family protein
VKGHKLNVMKRKSIQDEATKAVDYIELKITSPGFQHEGWIPGVYTCEGMNISPPLDIQNIPGKARCLALIVDDPDAPVRTWVHWVVWNIPVTHHLREDKVHGREGLNDFQQHKYRGPCPPSGTHRYFFKVYALDALLNLPSDAGKRDLEKAMSDHIIAFGEMIGLYKKGK